MFIISYVLSFDERLPVSSGRTLNRLLPSLLSVQPNLVLKGILQLADLTAWMQLRKPLIANYVDGKLLLDAGPSRYKDLTL